MIVKDRVRQQVPGGGGTGTLTLTGGAINGFLRFAGAFSSDTPTYYAIEDGSSWEVGMGTYYASSDTITRDIILASSDSGNHIDVSIQGLHTLYVKGDSEFICLPGAINVCYRFNKYVEIP